MIYENNYNVRDDLKSLSVEDLKKISDLQAFEFSVASVNLRGDLNLGTMMRTAHLCGARDFFILGHRGYDRRSTVGAQNYINVHKETMDLSFETVDNYLSEKGYTAIYVEQGGSLRPNTPIVGRFCYVFGPESGGIPFPTPVARTLEIPQMGVMRSHNVAVSCGIICYNRMENE